MRSGNAADYIKGIVHIRDPVTHRLIQCVLEGFRPRLDRHDLGIQEFHAIDVYSLSFDILRAHVDHALHPEARSHGSRRYTVLARSRLSDDPRLAHASREQRLTNGIVDLVRTGMIEIFAFQVDLGAAEPLTEPPRKVERRGPTDIVPEVRFHFANKIDIVTVTFISRTQLDQRLHECLGDKHASVASEMPPLVRQVIAGGCRCRGRGLWPTGDAH